MRDQQGFLIELENPIRSFFPGQTIVGRVLVSSHKVRDVKYIDIKFEGKARVQWTESKTVTTGTGAQRRSDTIYKKYIADEPYFECKIMLIGNESGTVVLQPGTISYPFQFTLPINLPSSYTNIIGAVHYSMEALMKRSWNKSDIKSIVPFTVNGILDLNTEPGVTDFIELKKHKNVCCCCCKSGPVGYTIKLGRNGFVPGEFAGFNLDMINMSRRKVKRVEVSLVQVSTFYAGGKSKTLTNTIYKVNSPSLDRGGSDSWGGNVLKIPAIPPTRLATCRIIDVQYLLNFEMHLSGAATNLKAQVPIVIGTIPLRNTFVDLMPSTNVLSPVPSYSISGTDFAQPMMPGPSAPRAFDTLPPPSAPVFDMYPDLPPPTYAEAMQMDMTSVSLVNEQTNSELDKGGKTNVAYLPGSAEKERNAGSEGNNNTNTDPEPLPRFESGYVINYITYGFNTTN